MTPGSKLPGSQITASRFVQAAELAMAVSQVEHGAFPRLQRLTFGVTRIHLMRSAFLYRGRLLLAAAISELERCNTYYLHTPKGSIGELNRRP